LTASKLLFGFFGGMDLFALRLPLLVADLAIFLVLIRWIKNRQLKVLWYYWCSPIIFAVSYVAGFLDIIPIAFLFISLYFLFREKYFLAFIILGLSLATKTGLVILLPFAFVYLLKEYEHPLRALQYLFLSFIMYMLFNVWFLEGPGFLETVLSGGQSFASNIGIDFGGVVLYIAPLVYIGLLAASLAFQRLHRDMFLMFIAFSLGAITLFVLPQAGWYSWILPFFAYFFAKEERVGTYPFILLHLAFFAYFILVPDYVLLNALLPTSFLSTNQIAVNTAFTLLQGALLLNIVWVYRLGIQQGMRHKILYKPYLIGIAGDSASGKSTLTRLISQVFGGHNTLEVAGDDMHKWERGDSRLSHITHLNPLANKLHDDMEHALQLKQNESVMRNFYDHTVGRFTSAERVRPKKIIVLQGLHTLYLHTTRNLLDLKVFLSPNENLRRRWKLERDVVERGGDQESVLKQLEARSADSEKYIQEQKKYADVVLSVDWQDSNQVLEIQCDNSINIDLLVESLKNKTGLLVSHEHGDDVQRFVVEGVIQSEEVEELAYELVPDIWELNRKEQQWEGGINGVIQLFLASVVFYKAKLEHHGL
jgi:uridine kinase